MNFPAPDPIPLPAPVWLFKLLSLLTLGLHFSAVMILVGSLILVTWLNWRGRSIGSLEKVQASHVVARQMPVLMTYVINLGVPPLLFLQVLYGRQIYSSSVLIGALWISVIFLLMLAYWMIYRVVNRIENRKAAWPVSLAALLVVMGIGQIYSMNMTLMLRPEVWKEMYSNSPSGLQGVHGDPTMNARWMFIMFGGPLFGGLWAALLSNIKHLSGEVSAVVRQAGGKLALVGTVGMLFFGYQAIVNQPESVRAAISGNALPNISLILCAATTALAGVLGLLQGLAKASNAVVSTLGVVLAFSAATTAGIVRDTIRDATLLSKGFDVNQGSVYPNWSVLAAFLILFVIMLGIIFWLLNVVRIAYPPNEEVAL